MNEDAIYKAVSSIVRDVTGVSTCVRANDVAAAPKGDYCSVLISGSVDPTALGRKERKTSDDGLFITTTVYIPIIYSITCNFYRKDSIARATKMINCFRLPTVNGALFKAGLGWAGSDPVQNLTDLQSGSMEERASIVVRLVGELKQTDKVNTILSVPIRVEDEAEHTLFDKQIQIKGN